jgi:hypothetical protein
VYNDDGAAYTLAKSFDLFTLFYFIIPPHFNAHVVMCWRLVGLVLCDDIERYDEYIIH